MADENTSEITVGRKVLVPGEVGKVFTPMGRDYQLVWLREGRFEFRPEQCVSLDVLRDVLRDLTDSGECRFDHHGYCQEHVWLTDERPCLHPRARALLAQLGEV